MSFGSRQIMGHEEMKRRGGRRGREKRRRPMGRGRAWFRRLRMWNVECRLSFEGRLGGGGGGRARGDVYVAAFRQHCAQLFLSSPSLVPRTVWGDLHNTVGYEVQKGTSRWFLQLSVLFSTCSNLPLLHRRKINPRKESVLLCLET